MSIHRISWPAAEKASSAASRSIALLQRTILQSARGITRVERFAPYPLHLASVARLAFDIL